MSRIGFSAVMAGIVALLASTTPASLATAASSSPVRAVSASSGAAKISLRHTRRFGNVLVNSRGFTLYEFSRDSSRTDRCVTRSGCRQFWPLVKTNGRPQAGRGVNRSMLGSIPVRGAHQVTYGGRPLYTYSGDTSPGSTSYVGVSQFGGVWRAVRASGKTAG